MMKSICAIIVLACFSACGQQRSHNPNYGKAIASTWLPKANATQPTTLPLDGIDLTGARYDQMDQIPVLNSNNVLCNSIIQMHGDEDQGTFILTPMSVDPSDCMATAQNTSGGVTTYTQNGTYQRLNVNDILICLGTSCALYE